MAKAVAPALATLGNPELDAMHPQGKHMSDDSKLHTRRLGAHARFQGLYLSSRSLIERRASTHKEVRDSMALHAAGSVP